MSMVCNYFRRCSDKEKDGSLCITNKVCAKCALNPNGKKGHYFEPQIEECEMKGCFLPEGHAGLHQVLGRVFDYKE